MIAKKYAILTTSEVSFWSDFGNCLNREFVKNGAIFFDYEDIYLKHGKRGAENFIKRILEQNDIKVVIYHPDSSSFHFSLDFFEDLHKKFFTVFMVGDTDHFFNIKDIYYAQCMDLVVVFDCLSRYRFRRYGIDAISFNGSYDKEKYFKIDSLKKNIAVSFVGDIANKINRKTYIDYVAKHGIFVETFGTGSKTGKVSHEKVVEIYNSSKINLNFAGLLTKNPFIKEPNINLRLRQIKGKNNEVSMCGSIVLSEYAPGTEEMFEIGKEIDVFHDEEEMVEKIRYYLVHEAEREEIAKNGYAR